MIYMTHLSPSSDGITRTNKSTHPNNKVVQDRCKDLINYIDKIKYDYNHIGAFVVFKS